MCLNTVYFAENWKYYNKIIFKYVNSAVRLIFNESFAEKKMFVGSINNARDTLEKQKNHKNALLKKKKKKKKKHSWPFHRYPNRVPRNWTLFSYDRIVQCSWFFFQILMYAFACFIKLRPYVWDINKEKNAISGPQAHNLVSVI